MRKEKQQPTDTDGSYVCTERDLLGKDKHIYIELATRALIAAVASWRIRHKLLIAVCVCVCVFLGCICWYFEQDDANNKMMNYDVMERIIF